MYIGDGLAAPSPKKSPHRLSFGRSLSASERALRGRAGDLLDLFLGQGLALRGHAHPDLAGGELDALSREELADVGIHNPAQHELLSGPGHELDADDLAGVVDLAYALRLQRLDALVADDRVGGEFLAELLDQLADALGVGVERDADRQLHDDPVARVVRQLRDLAEGYRVQRPVLVAHLHRADRDVLDRPAQPARLD